MGWNYPRGSHYPILFDVGEPDAQEAQQLSTRSGVLRAARGQASGPRGSKSRTSTASSRKVRRQRRAATSSDELQPAAGGGGELRGSKSRKSTVHSPPCLSVSGCGVRPGHRRCPAAGPAVLRTAKARPHTPPEEQAQPKARPQFSAPGPPHCGSAVAPPRFRAPCAIHSISAHRRNS